jgi:hypothetical protein
LDSGDRGPPAEPGGRRLRVCRCCYGGRALLLPEEAERCRGRKLLPEAAHACVGSAISAKPVEGTARGGGGVRRPHVACKRVGPPRVGPCPVCVYIYILTVCHT